MPLRKTEARKLRTAPSALLVAPLLLCAACRTEVAHDLSEAEATRIVAMLSEQGIAGEIVAGSSRDDASWTVAVPTSEAARARLALSQRQMPSEPEDGLAEVFDRGGLVPTPTEERARLVRAIQGELSETLESLDGVVAARVHVSLPETRRGLLPPGEDAPEASASVVIRHEGERPPLSEDEVRGIVAGAISELRPERITVVAVATREPRRAAEGAGVVPLGPFSVAPSSVSALRAWLVGSSCAVGVLGVTLVVLVVRIRSLRRRTASGDAGA